MKRILLLAAVLLVAASCGSTANMASLPETTREDTDLYNFHRESGDVYWSEVFYYAPEDSAAVREWMLRSFPITENREDRVIVTTEKKCLPVTEAGMDRMSTSIILLKPSVINFVAEFRHDRMRITVEDITWYWDTGLTTRSGIYSVSQSFTPSSFEEIAIKDGIWNNTFYKFTAKQLQQQFEYIFTPRLRKERQEW